MYRFSSLKFTRIRTHFWKNDLIQQMTIIQSALRIIIFHSGQLQNSIMNSLHELPNFKPHHLLIRYEEEGFDDKPYDEQLYERYDPDSPRRGKIRKKKHSRVNKEQLPKPCQSQEPMVCSESLDKIVAEIAPRRVAGEPRRRSPPPTQTKEQTIITPSVRFPIEYSQYNRELQHNKKVVYRGMAPRSSHLYFKVLKDIQNYNQGRSSLINNSSKSSQHLSYGLTMEIDPHNQLSFDSKFESGNLQYALKMSNNEYWLYMREDTNSKGQKQWFYFRVYNRKQCKIRFRIYKYTKSVSLYQRGAKPFVQQPDGSWIQQGENMKYLYDPISRSFYLQFDYSFQIQATTTYFATLPPYSYTRLNSYIQGLSHSAVKKSKLSLNSLGGLPIPVIEINELKQQQTERQYIFVIGRTHPGETVSSFTIESMIENILNHPWIMQRFIFVVVPMLNPDGVFIGNYRTGLIGQDFNRHFDEQDQQFFPEITAFKKLVRQTKKKGRIRFCFDMHGHSSKRNIFAFAGEQDPTSARYVYSNQSSLKSPSLKFNVNYRILPEILSRNFSIFQQSSCQYKNIAEKTKTARVHLSSKEKIVTVTFEQSFALFDDPKFPGSFLPLGERNWRNFGAALISSLAQYSLLTHHQAEPVKKLREYLPQPEHALIIQTKPIRQVALTTCTTSDWPPEIAHTKPLPHSSLIRDEFTRSQHQFPHLTKEQISKQSKISEPTTLKEIDQQAESQEEELEMNNEELENWKMQVRRTNKNSSPRPRMAIPEKQPDLGDFNYGKNERMYLVMKPTAPRIIKLQKEIRSHVRSLHRPPETSKLSMIELPYINKRY